MWNAVRKRWRHILPWLISIGLLVYVFGWATDWQSLQEALVHVDVPRYLAATTIDRLAFFVVWTYFQARITRHFVPQVSMGAVFALRGGSELLRAVSNPLADGAFYLGLSQLVHGRLDVVVAVAIVPLVCHMLVMLAQVSLALIFIEGGIAGNQDVAIAAAIVWVLTIAVAVAMRYSTTWRIPGAAALRQWLAPFTLRDLMPFLVGFAGVAAFDVLIQGIATRAFGTPIDWWALVARIPLLYLALVIPSFGNFGTRELTWAALFEGFADRDALIAFAFATNAIFWIINVVLGVVFLPRAMELISEVRRARREGEPVPEPLFSSPTDP